MITVLRIPVAFCCLLHLSYLATASSYPGLPLPAFCSPHATPTPEGNWNTIRLPIKRIGNLLFLEARIDTLVGDFILDTGAPYLILNKTYFRERAQGQKLTAVGVDGLDAPDVASCTIPLLELGAVSYKYVGADITPLGQLESKSGRQVFGLLGMNLFSSLMMEIDIQENAIVLHRLDDLGVPITPIFSKPDSLGYSSHADVTMPFKFCDNKVFLNVVVAGQNMNWILDTGAETNVVDAWTRKKVLNTFHVRKRTTLIGTAGQQQEVLLGVLEEMKVGTESFKLQQTLVTSMRELSETCSLYIDGILGFSFIQRGKLLLNFKTNELTMYLYAWQ
jgi:predicted aspartyl protease